MPTQIERIKALETKQQSQEQRCAEDRDKQTDLRSEVTALQTEVSLMGAEMVAFGPKLESMGKDLKTLVNDKLARDTLGGDRRQRKLDGKDWLLVAVAIVAVIIALPAALQSIKEIFK